MPDKTDEDRLMLEHDIADYLLEKGYPAPMVRSMIKRHRFKGLRGVRLLAENLNRPNLVILNLGCGSGMNHYHIVKELPRADIYGLDIDGHAVELCRRYNPTVSENICKYDGEKMPFINNFFDGIVCETVIEHVSDSELFLTEIYRVLKNNGFLYITTANKLWPLEPHYNLFGLSWMSKKVANRYMRIFKRKNNYDDINLPTYGRFLKDLQGAGFKIRDVTFDVMEHPELYDADKERPILKFLKPLASVLSLMPHSLKYVVQHLNLGWIIIAKKL